MIPPLWLDYQRRSLAHRRLGMAVLALGVLAVAGVLFEFLTLKSALEEGQVAVTRLKREAARSRLLAPATNGTGRAGLVATGRDDAGAVTHSTARWEIVFAALEKAADDSVTLLALRSGASELQLGAEASSLGAAADYVKRLQSGTAFSSVYLTQSEVVRGHPQRPVRFSLVAEWKGGA
jgi:hypothetical protein